MNGRHRFGYIANDHENGFPDTFAGIAPVFAADGTIEDAIALYENGEYKQAESLLARLGESQPGHAELWVWLSRRD